MSKAKNTLVVGYNGFVGSALVKRLSKTADRLFLVSKIKGGFQPKNAKVFYGDLENKDFCKRVLKNIDLVYYVAGYKKNIAFHTAEPFDFFVGNVLPLITFLEVLKKSKVETLVYLSSTIVEYANAAIDDGYVLGKSVNERLLKSFIAQFPSISVKIVRSAPIYGPGDNFNKQTANFIPSMINKIHESDKEIEIWGNGKRKLQFIFIEDLIDNFIAASKIKKGALYTIGNGEAVSVIEIVKKIVKRSGKRLRLNFNFRKPDKPSRLVSFDNLIAPKYNLDRGLDETIKYFYNKKFIIMHE